MASPFLSSHPCPQSPWQPAAPCNHSSPFFSHLPPLSPTLSFQPPSDQSFIFPLSPPHTAASPSASLPVDQPPFLPHFSSPTPVPIPSSLHPPPSAICPADLPTLTTKRPDRPCKATTGAPQPRATHLSSKAEREHTEKNRPENKLIFYAFRVCVWLFISVCSSFVDSLAG